MNNVLQTIVSQWGNSPTILALIESFNAAVDPAPDLDAFLTHVWQVDTAQGFGLDIWGRIVDIERIIHVPSDTPNPGGFEFSDINSVKPEMLAEALKNAKDTAAQIAKESGSALGELHRGNQGTFDITDKDPGSPEYKKIRVVSTLRFLLN